MIAPPPPVVNTEPLHRPRPRHLSKTSQHQTRPEAIMDNESTGNKTKPTAYSCPVLSHLPQLVQKPILSPSALRADQDWQMLGREVGSEYALIGGPVKGGHSCMALTDLLRACTLPHNHISFTLTQNREEKRIQHWRGIRLL